jgi:phosphate acetyltransferase
MSFIEGLYPRAVASNRKVILPEQEDPRVLEAAQILIEESLATPVFLSAPARPVPGSVQVADLADPDELDRRCGEHIRGLKRRKPLTPEAVAQSMRHPLTRAAAILGAGYVDLGIAGSIATTGEVIRAGLTGVGLRDQVSLVSSIFLMEFPGKVLTYSDCAVIPDPDAGQLAQIAVNAAEAHGALTGKAPKVAMLSFSTCGSASHPSVDKVREATAIARSLAPGLSIDGEFQYDAATVPKIGKQKAPGSSIAGECDVLIFPDLNAGNIAYKIAQREAGARAIGPLLLGFRRPWMDLSRGCSSRDIVDLCVVAMTLR